MSSVERVTRKNTSAIQEFLTENGVDLGRLPLNPDEKIAVVNRELINKYSSNQNESSSNPLSQDTYENGLILIKPEMLPYYEQYLDFLQKYNIDICSISAEFRPTHEQWMAQYGAVLAEYPRAIHCYIAQRSIGVRVVSFVHNPEEYLTDINRVCIDPDYSFDQKFCGQADTYDPHTLRGSVSYSTLSRLGFDSMTGYAEPFDMFGYYKNKDSTPLRTYNGIHIPCDQVEKMNNYNMFGSVL